MDRKQALDAQPDLFAINEIVCRRCFGKGTVRRSKMDYMNNMVIRWRIVQCPICKGLGRVKEK